MKKATTIVLLLALTILMSVGVSALQITSPTIGDDNQDRVANVSTSFSVTNNGTSTVTVTFSHTADAKFNIRITPSSANLSAGETKTFTITGDIPLDFDAVEKNPSASDYLKEKAFVIGQLTASAGTDSVTTDIKMQAVNQLRIDDAKIECVERGRSVSGLDAQTQQLGKKRESLDDGDDVENLRPDMDCTLEVTVENRFSDDDDKDQFGNDLKIGDIEFDDVDVEIEIDDPDFDEDEDERINSLNADDKDEVSIDFEIDEDVDDGTFDMEIRVFGKDDNGAFHGEKWEIDLEVERFTHDLQIRSLSVNPTRISACTGGTVKVSSGILNLGKRDEDEVAVEAEVPDLNILERVELFEELDEDDSIGTSLKFDVPKGVREGVYRGTFTTFFDKVAPSNTASFELTIDKCVEEKSVEVVEETKPETSAGSQAQPTQTTTSSPTSTAGSAAVAVPRQRVRSQGFTESPAYLWLLGIASVVLLIIVIALLAVAFRKPKQPQF